MSKLCGFTLILLSLIPWLIIQVYTRIPGDAAFLFSGMEMLFSGSKMSDSFYDTNPPMSFLIYAPATFIHYLGFSKHLAIQLYTLAFTTLSIIISYYFLQKWKSLGTTALFVILSYYISSITIFTYAEYAQKDHLIAISLLPFLLMQLSITNKHNVSPYILWTIVLIYAPFILLKPHFGILPVALLFHRLYTQKNLKSLLDIDFLGLSITTIAYILFIFLYTPDYISEILPASLQYYAGSNAVIPMFKTSLGFIIFTASVTFFAKTSKDKTDTKKLCEVFAWLGMLSLIAFIVQNKGFAPHLIPSVSLISVPLGLLIYFYIKEKTLNTNKNKIFNIISILLAFIIFYTPFVFKQHVLTIDEYKTSSMAKFISEKAKTQPFFFETYTTNIISTVGLYLPNDIASRFPSLWFLVNFNDLSTEEQKITWDKYGRIMAQDIKIHKPKLIAIIKYNDPEKGFLAMFKNHKEFQEQWKNYVYDSQYTISKSEFNDILLDEEDITYNVYLRK